MTTSVYLVGAGPGDPSLLTLKAARILKKADVVLYDFLVHPNILNLCKPTALLTCVGKRKGHHSKKQSQIHALILSHVKKNRILVRLKGGDPLIFGRGGEEMEYLAQHGINFEVIPGISSAIAVPEYAGIPLTHRKLSRSVAFVTGSLQNGKFNHVIPTADTLVCLMGLHTLSELISAILKKRNMTLQTPAVLLYRGTTSDEKKLLGTLEDIVSKKEAQNLGTPSLLVVGKVASLAKTLDWRSKLPLYRKRLVLLRTLEQGEAWKTQLEDLGAEVLECPLITTKPNLTAWKPISGSYLERFSMVIFTSPNGVRYFIEGLLKKGLDTRHFSKKKLVAIGPKTAETLRQYGLIADILPAHSVAEGILDILPLSIKEDILIPCASDARTFLKNELKSRGAQVKILKIYTTKPTSQKSFEWRPKDWVIFTSSSTATHFYTHPCYHHQPINALCLGPITAQTVKTYQQENVFQSQEATFESLLSMIVSQEPFMLK